MNELEEYLRIEHPSTHHAAVSNEKVLHFLCDVFYKYGSIDVCFKTERTRIL